jgi:L-ascorbate metabolism protein UlaG (beta-lactamase superfamily)
MKKYPRYFVKENGTPTEEPTIYSIEKDGLFAFWHSGDYCYQNRVLKEEDFEERVKNGFWREIFKSELVLLLNC